MTGLEITMERNRGHNWNKHRDVRRWTMHGLKNIQIERKHLKKLKARPQCSQQLSAGCSRSRNTRPDVINDSQGPETLGMNQEL